MRVPLILRQKKLNADDKVAFRYNLLEGSIQAHIQRGKVAKKRKAGTEFVFERRVKGRRCGRRRPVDVGHEGLQRGGEVFYQFQIRIVEGESG